MNPKVGNDPTNRVVSVFRDPGNAAEARSSLQANGFHESRIRVLEGDRDADSIDTSAKWFADTDLEMKRLERELRDGSVVLAVAIEDRERRSDAEKILKAHDAAFVIHFGEWVTKIEQ